MGDVALLVTAITGLLSVVLTYWNKNKIKDVHVLVNQQRTDALNRIKLLTKMLEDAGVEVPPD